jgi:hypothetical protein
MEACTFDDARDVQSVEGVVDSKDLDRAKRYQDMRIVLRVRTECA